MPTPHSPEHVPSTMPTVTRGGALAPTRAVLPNGSVVIAKETRKTPAVTINLAIRAGALCDPPDGCGAVYLLSKLLDRGTERHSADEIADALESRGASLSMAVNRHALSIYCTCLAEDFEPVLEMVGELVTSPTLPDAEIATRKGEVITAIAQDEDSPYVVALMRLMALLYGESHPYGRPLKGTQDSVQGLTRERLLALLRERFTPDAVSLVMVGDLPPARAVDAASRVFGDWKTAAAPPIHLVPPTPATTRRRLVVPMMNKAQADLAYGFTTIERADPTYYAASLMNNVLGQYALGGRLGDSIRERQGMAYYVSSAFEANVIAGPLLIRAGVAPDNVERAIASIDEELRRIRTDGVTQQELDESRQYLVGSMPRQLETNAGIASFLQNAEFFGLGLDFDARLPQLLHAVTRDEVHAAARRLLDPDVATIVIAGPYAESE